METVGQAKVFCFIDIDSNLNELRSGQENAGKFRGHQVERAWGSEKNAEFVKYRCRSQALSLLSETTLVLKKFYRASSRGEEEYIEI